MYVCMYLLYICILQIYPQRPLQTPCAVPCIGARRGEGRGVYRVLQSTYFTFNVCVCGCRVGYIYGRYMRSTYVYHIYLLVVPRAQIGSSIFFFFFLCRWVNTLWFGKHLAVGGQILGMQIEQFTTTYIGLVFFFFFFWCFQAKTWVIMSLH